MSNNQIIMGRWHKIKSRCQRCGRPRDMGYRVDTDGFSGTFCGRFCAEAAYNHFKEVKYGKNAETQKV